MRMRIRIQLFTLMQIRIMIRLLFKVICLQSLVYGLSKAFKFDFNVDPDPAFQSNAGPDPASQNNADTDTLPKTHIKITFPILTTFWQKNVLNFSYTGTGTCSPVYSLYVVCSTPEVDRRPF
jgi:hypothetical protein